MTARRTPPLDPVVARGRRAVSDALADLPGDATVVFGVSGGADSLALAALTSFVVAGRGGRALALVVDHGLQAGSDQVAQRAAAQSRDLGVEARVERVDVGSDGGPEGAARVARREALQACADELGAAAVLLAHTRDDQAETVLLGLARGSGARSLAGMAPRTGIWRRPLLGLTRADTEQVCRAVGLTWWDDPHNDDARYARVRVRRTVLPLLERELGPGVAAALARTADGLRDDADALDVLARTAAREVTRDDGALDVAALAALPRALRTRVLRAAAIGAGSTANDLTAAHVAGVEQLVTAWRGQGGPALPGGLTVRRTGGVLLFIPS
ncbi:tRNA lysidine(34) synthetase TilS [Mumia sp. ZJ1417]|uniref:tRNA lysidine(34) synthetase TilS n=1 Tax=unclassified Mumia TaxID=2621872 RepID=UPI00141DA8A8|nr:MULTISPECIES: tRNA lysidine(34) synthetase TilS [unclassified Mumia]QMW65968.1 tRNA lysidine(34) synthetase TilS [Mumia sp. ZJ1417]